MLHLLSSHLTHFWEKWDWADRSLNQSEDSICQILCQILFLSESSLSSPKLYQMAEPCSNLAQILLKPRSNLAQTSLKPCSNLAERWFEASIWSVWFRAFEWGLSEVWVRFEQDLSEVWARFERGLRKVLSMFDQGLIEVRQRFDLVMSEG